MCSSLYIKKPTVSAIKTFQSIIFIALFSIGLSLVYAWTGPTGVAPTNNVSAPVNIGTSIQVKLGDLGVANFIADAIAVGSTFNLGAITSPKYCIGTSCITSWPTGGSGAGTGSGWVNVSLTDTSNFDVTCDYRVNFSGSIHYATRVFVSGISITNDSSSYTIVYNQRSYGGAVTQIEKNCGGGGTSSAGGSKILFSQLNSVYGNSKTVPTLANGSEQLNSVVMHFTVDSNLNLVSSNGSTACSMARGWCMTTAGAWGGIGGYYYNFKLTPEGLYYFIQNSSSQGVNWATTIPWEN